MPSSIEENDCLQIKKIDMKCLKEDIKNNTDLNGEFLQEETDCLVCIKVYNDAASAVLDKHAPEKTKTMTIRPAVKWYTDKVAKARREKKKWERKWRATKLSVHWELFAQAKNTLTWIIITEKKD